ncbi:amino acid ABC transporter ATP-binding protein [Anaerorhabdus sp.]|uniref:amino acid ABC transporter ATP-binding protein n=1 Tax=Anaerorhabdus sp. TaxID=1872524 RepID=UPI002FCA3E83
MLKVKDIVKSFDGNQVLKGVSFDVNKEDVVMIIGPSGSGKTTLLRSINFLTHADSGLINFDDEVYELNKITKKDIYKIRKRTAFVFQNFNLFRNKTVLGNVTEGLVVTRKINRNEANRIGKASLDKVGLSDKYDAYPHELSGGQQQRVAIARAIATNPELILFDEPTSALDPELIQEVLSVIKQLAQEGMTMILVTHELSFAKNIGTKIVFMDHGEIIEQNNVRDFFQHPKQERTKQFLASFQDNHRSY